VVEPDECCVPVTFAVDEEVAVVDPVVPSVAVAWAVVVPVGPTVATPVSGERVKELYAPELQ